MNTSGYEMNGPRRPEYTKEREQGSVGKGRLKFVSVVISFAQGLL